MATPDLGAYEYNGTPGGGSGGGSSTNLAPAVSAIGHNATDVDSVLAGVQIYGGITVQYTGKCD